MLHAENIDVVMSCSRQCSVLVEDSGGYQGEKKAKDKENAREEDGEREGVIESGTICSHAGRQCLR